MGRALEKFPPLLIIECHQLELGGRIIAAITQGEVIRKILQPLKLAVDPPLIAPAHVRQEAFAWSSA